RVTVRATRGGTMRALVLFLGIGWAVVGIDQRVALAQTCSSLSCGRTASGTIANPNDVDCYSFSGNENDVVAITVAGTTEIACWQLVGPDGQAVGDKTCRAFFDPGQGERTLPVTGTYKIEVTGDDATPYGLTLESVSGSLGGASNGPPTPVCQGP